MARYCASCGAMMTEEQTTCPSCGKAAGAAGAGGGAPAAGGAGATGGLADNIAGAISYFAIVGIVFLLIEPYNKNKFVRFHAFQSIFLAVAAVGGSIVLGIIPILGWIVLPFFSLGIFILAVISAVKAFGNQRWKLPVIGEMAEKQANNM